MQTRILGTTMPVLEVELNPNESVFSESGELSWMTASIQMTTHTQMGGGGGFFGVLKRAAAGASIFMTEYRAVPVSRLGLVRHQGSRPHCARRARPGAGVSGAPSRLPLRHAAGHHHIGISAVARRGHLWRRWIPAATRWRRGHGVARALRRARPENLAPGEVLRVHPGHVGAFQASVGFHRSPWFPASRT
jgi:hypothetical protein